MFNRQAGFIKLDDMEYPDQASSDLRVLWSLIKGTEVLQEKVNSQQQADLTKISQKAFSMIVIVINLLQIYLVTACESLNTAWRALRSHFKHEMLMN